MPLTYFSLGPDDSISVRGSSKYHYVPRMIDKPTYAASSVYSRNTEGISIAPAPPVPKIATELPGYPPHMVPSKKKRIYRPTSSTSDDTATGVSLTNSGKTEWPQYKPTLSKRNASSGGEKPSGNDIRGRKEETTKTTSGSTSSKSKKEEPKTSSRFTSSKSKGKTAKPSFRSKSSRRDRNGGKPKFSRSRTHTGGHRRHHHGSHSSKPRRSTPGSRHREKPRRIFSSPLVFDHPLEFDHTYYVYRREKKRSRSRQFRKWLFRWIDSKIALSLASSFQPRRSRKHH